MVHLDGYVAIAGACLVGVARDQWMVSAAVGEDDWVCGAAMDGVRRSAAKGDVAAVGGSCWEGAAVGPWAAYDVVVVGVASEAGVAGLAETSVAVGGRAAGRV